MVPLPASLTEVMVGFSDFSVGTDEWDGKSRDGC